MTYIDGPFTLTDKPLWWHLKGLQQTASGYGRKLTSRYVILLPGERKPRRLYVVQFSNSGTHYVVRKGKAEYPDPVELQVAYDKVRGRD